MVFNFTVLNLADLKRTRRRALCVHCAFESQIKSNHFYIIKRSRKDYYKQPGSGGGIWEGSFVCEFSTWVAVC